MFHQFQLAPELLRSIQRQGYVEPTPIQASAIPPALAGRNLIATAETGSGKTAAFLLPVIKQLLPGPTGCTRALILSPTREIATQTEGQARELSRYTRLRSAAIYGGVGMEAQELALRAGVDIVVATPGRLLDHIGRGTARLKGISVLVLDEADRMMDMGFLPDLRRILAHLPEARQTLLFSATMPAEILALAGEVMTDPVRIVVGQHAMPPESVFQAVYPVAPERKTELLLHLLQGDTIESALVFTRTKHRADRLARQLRRENVAATCIHGDRTQRQREAALVGFRQGAFRVLVATDIAARGLDINGVTHVINYDLPRLPEDYVHRIGRTARAGASGNALSLATTEDGPALTNIEQALGHSIRQVVLAGFSNRGSAATEPSRPYRRFRRAN